MGRATQQLGLENLVGKEKVIANEFNRRAKINLYEILSTAAIEAGMEDDLDAMMDNIKKHIEKEVEIFHQIAKTKLYHINNTRTELAKECP